MCQCWRMGKHFLPQTLTSPSLESPQIPFLQCGDCIRTEKPLISLCIVVVPWEKLASPFLSLLRKMKPLGTSVLCHWVYMSESPSWTFPKRQSPTPRTPADQLLYKGMCPALCFCENSLGHLDAGHGSEPENAPHPPSSPSI